MDEHEVEVLSENPHDKASWLSKLTFIWAIGPVVKTLRGVNIANEKYTSVPKLLKANKLSHQLQKQWENREKSGKPPKLLWILIGMYLKDVIKSSVLHFGRFSLIGLSQCFLIRMLLTSYAGNVNDENVLFQRRLSSGLLVMTTLFSPFLSHHAQSLAEHIGAQIRVATSSVVYQKLLRISTAEMQRMNIGQLINIFASDVGRFENIARITCTRILDPLTIALYVTFLQLTVGLAGLIGFLVVLVLGVSFLHFGRFFKALSRKKVDFVDKRLKLTRELITEARTMKLQCWEKAYSDAIIKIRKQELKLCFYNYCYKIMFRTLSIVSAPLGMFTVLNLMLIFGTPITSQAIYPCLTVLNISQLIIIMVTSRVMENGSFALVSIKRIESILKLDEISKVKKNLKEEPSVLKNVSCSWNPILNPQDEDKFMLKNINLTLPFKTITMVTGPVASGKSTLLLAMANEMFVHSGEIKMGGSLTYLPQEPWLFPASIRQNILFGLPYDENRYHNIMSSCALLHDLVQFPNGDSSKVDDKGLTLSGGQKARIALARALYRQSEIYLLDDPLSAVDVKVGRHIWENCFQKTNKTIILVSHSLQFLTNNSHVVYIEKGMVESGSFKDFQEQLNFCIPPDTVDEAMESSGNDPETTLLSTKKDNESDVNELVLNTLHSKIISENSLLLYCKMAVNLWNGYGVLLLIIVLLFLAQAANTTYNICFISVVYDHASKLNGSFQMRSGIRISNVPIAYLGYLILLETSIRISLFFIYFYMCSRASRNLHESMLWSVIKTHLVFFDKHYTGQIINRFSKDVETIDDQVPLSLFEILRVMLQLIGYLINASYSNYIVIAPIMACMTLLALMVRVYEKIAHSLKTKEASARSPIYTYMNCTTNGVALIRSHENQKKVGKEFNARQDLHSAVWFTLSGLNEWNAFNNELVGIIITTSVIVIALLLPTNTNNSKLGMAVSSILTFGSSIQMALKLYIECSQTIFSVSRINSYIGLPKEAGYEINEKSMPPAWPQEGRIHFNNVSLTYGTSKTPALKNISCTIQPGEKIGIVGRTGAGKTSLVAALFRLTEIEGKIEISGVDITTIPLSGYRNKLSVIPQNPVILSGSVRHNLDPRGEFEDEEMWNALECVDLKDEISKMGFDLDDDLSQLSVGQKQLFCLARTLLHQNKIIILDEATSNVDNKTDQIIQQLIRTKFFSSTILVIAHRLQTVLDLDRIMVMQNGEIVEFDTVEKLLSKPNGVFRSMIEKAKLDPIVKITA